VSAAALSISKSPMILRMMIVVSTLLISLSAALVEANITVSNGESAQLFIVVYDMNTRERNRILDTTMSSGQSIPLYITGERGYDGHIRGAQAADRESCGTGDLSNLTSGTDVTVKAPLECHWAKWPRGSN
jgi:hypothetical protein